MMNNIGKYYLYRHIRLDKNEPFYIGIATKYPEDYLYNTYKYKRAYQKSGRNPIWKKIIDKSKYEVEILMETNDRNFILQKEIEFIKLYGRIDLKTGTLANLTDGGDYFDGYICTPNRNKKISESNKGRKVSKKEGLYRAQKRKEFALKRGYYFTDETKKRMSDIRLGKKLSIESIIKRTETRKNNSEGRGYYISNESKIIRGYMIRINKIGEDRLTKIISGLENPNFKLFKVLSEQTNTHPTVISRIKKDKEFINFFKQWQESKL